MDIPRVGEFDTRRVPKIMETPSIFELLACDSLKSGLREALRYLIDNIYQIKSIRELPIPRTDEAILILDLLIEYNYLRSYQASYAENLYNLVRLTRITHEKPERILPSLVCLTLVPYLRRKLDKYFEELNFKQTKTPNEQRNIRVYKLLSSSYSLINLVYFTRYTTGQSDNHELLMRLLGVCLKARTNDNENDDNLRESLPLADRISRLLADMFGKGLTVGSYMIQFLDYWNTHSNSAPLLGASLPIPERPNRDDDLAAAYNDERSSKLCLICLKARHNECALSNTGYVFCYSCLRGYVTTKRRCPITGHPTTEDNIVKLFTTPPNPF